MGKVQSVKFCRRASRAGHFFVKDNAFWGGSEAYNSPGALRAPGYFFVQIKFIHVSPGGAISLPVQQLLCWSNFSEGEKVTPGQTKVTPGGRKVTPGQRKLTLGWKNLLQENEFWPSSQGDLLYSECTPEKTYSNSEKLTLTLAKLTLGKVTPAPQLGGPNLL